MIRQTIFYLIVLAIMGLAVRRWFWGLCGLVFLTIFTQHNLMPKQMFGVQGLNPWNATLAFVILCWLMQRRLDPPAAPASSFTRGLFFLYIVMLGFLAGRAILDADAIKGKPAGEGAVQWLIVDAIINPIKYLIVGALFFDGARTRERAKLALFTAVGSGMAYAFLMFKTMKLGVFTLSTEGARRITDKLIGLFANDIAKVLAFTIWAALFLFVLLDKRWLKAGWALCVAATIPPYLALKSRAGFLAFCAIAFVLGLFRWRRILVLFPLAALTIMWAVPSVSERVLAGVGETSRDTDWDEVSAGRLTNIWPPVVEQIAKGPVFGFGRFAILREECYDEILVREKGVPNHPHCAYLEILVDGGIAGLTICMLGMGGIVLASIWLMRTRGDRLIAAVGVVSLTAAVAELAAGMAGSSFYPTQSTVPCLCVWGIALRFYREYAWRELHAPAGPPSPLWTAPAGVVAPLGPA